MSEPLKSAEEIYDEIDGKATGLSLAARWKSGVVRILSKWQQSIREDQRRICADIVLHAYRKESESYSRYMLRIEKAILNAGKENKP